MTLASHNNNARYSPHLGIGSVIEIVVCSGGMWYVVVVCKCTKSELVTGSAKKP